MMKPFEEAIYVTRPYLPPLETFCEGLGEIWENRWLTNEGPIVRRFVRQLSHYFETDNVCLFNNGTLALQIALEGMDISGEVITTPFTFVATTHALVLEQDPAGVCGHRAPVLHARPREGGGGDHPLDDRDPRRARLRPPLPRARPGRHRPPAPPEADLRLRRTPLASQIGGRSIAHFGDMNMFSFHATKPFHSIEGGMLTFRDSGLKKKLDYLKNFGFENEVEVVMPGTNAKMNEIQALMGSMILGCIDELIAKRRRVAEIYRERLSEIRGIRFAPSLPDDVRYNYAYVPVEIDGRQFGLNRDELYEELKTYNVYTRRYFYPLICDYTCYRSLAFRTR